MAHASIRLLLCKLGQFLLHVFPRFLAIHNAFDRSTDRVLVRPYLLGAVSVTKGEGAIFDRLKIDSDPERCPEFIVSRISFADRRRGIVNSIGYAKLP